MSLGAGSYAQSRLPDWLEVGNYSSVAGNVIFMENDEHHLCKYNKACVFTINFDQPSGNPRSKVGNDVWIGTQALILPGIKIGDGAIIGAAAVVSKDVPPFAVVVGNPATIKRYRFTDKQIEKLQRMRWWDWAEATIMEAKNDMKDIETFIQKYG